MKLNRPRFLRAIPVGDVPTAEFVQQRLQRAYEPRFTVYRAPIGHPTRTTYSIQARTASYAVIHACLAAPTCQSRSARLRDGVAHGFWAAPAAATRPRLAPAQVTKLASQTLNSPSPPPGCRSNPGGRDGTPGPGSRQGGISKDYALSSESRPPCEGPGPPVHPPEEVPPPFHHRFLPSDWFSLPADGHSPATRYVSSRLLNGGRPPSKTSIANRFMSGCSNAPLVYVILFPAALSMAAWTI